MTDESTTVVVQVGPVPGMPGGMASVISEYLGFDLPGFEMRSYPTYFPGHSVRGFVSALLFPIWALSCLPRRRKIVHVHLSEGGSFLREGLVVLVSSAMHFPVIASLHGAQFDEFAARRPALVKAVLQRCRSVLCLGREQARVVVAITSRPSVELLLNPVVLPSGREDVEREALVLFGGEVGLRKGIDRLLAAWPAVVAEVPDARLGIYGPLASNMDALPASARYEGTVTRDQLRSRLRSAQVACLPSRREVLPMFILESLAAGTPVVATKAGEWQSFDGAGMISWVDNSDDRAVAQLAVALVKALKESPTDADRRASAEWLNERASATAIGSVLERVYLSVTNARLHE